AGKDGFLSNSSHTNVDDFDELTEFSIVGDITINVDNNPISVDPVFLNDGNPDASNNYTLQISSEALVGIQGQVAIIIDADMVQDLAGNLGPESRETFIFNYDTIPPTPTITSNQVGASGRTNGDNSNNVTIDISWDDILFDQTGNGVVDENDSFLASDVQIIPEYIGAIDPGAPYYTINTALNGTDDTYNLVLSDLVDSTRYTIRISASAASDDAQNTGPIELVNYEFIYDTSPPQLLPFEVAGSVSGSITDSSFYRGNDGVAESVTIDFIWNELLFGFSSESITIISVGDEIEGVLADPVLENGNYRYTMSIDAAEFGGNEGLVRFRVGQNNVNDAAGNLGPAAGVDFSFTYDITPPDGSEVAAVSSPTNVDYPHVEVRSQDAISSGNDQITAEAYVWNDADGNNVIADSELQQIRLSVNDANNLQSSVQIHGTNTKDLFFGTADANSPVLPEGDYNIVLKLTDQALNVETLQLSSFTIDRTAPSSLIPAIQGITNVYTNPYTGAYFWNKDSSALSVAVQLPSDGTILGGTLQLRAKVRDLRLDIGSQDGLYQALAPPVSIDINNFSDDNLNGIWDEGENLLPITINVSDSYPSSDIGFEELNVSFLDSIEIYISAMITDRAGNTNCTDENGIVEEQVDLYKSLTPVIVDQRDPAIGSLQSITGIVNGEADESNVYSEGREGFWNISTDSLAFVLNLPDSDGDGRDESLINGFVSIIGRLNVDIDSIGIKYQINDSHFEGDLIRISIPDTIDGFRNGIQEFVNDFYDNHNALIDFDITITDIAGNQRSWTDAKNVKIDLTPPTISTITSTDNEGWYNINDTISIRIQSATDDIIVNSSTVITLNTGSVSGVAAVDYIGNSLPALNHDFSYDISANHTSANNANSNGDPDGLLEVIDFSPKSLKTNNNLANPEVFWVTSITDEAGNFLPFSSARIDRIDLDVTDNVPLANNNNSLDGQVAIKVDAVVPGSFNLYNSIPFKAIGGTSSSARPPQDGNIWETNDGIYWNATHTSLKIKIPFPFIDDTTDFSLANSANEQGQIRLRATLQQENINTLTNDEFVYLGDPVNIDYNRLLAFPDQEIIIQKSILEGLDPDGDLDSSVIRINAEIYDIAGNVTLGDLSQPGEIKIIEVDYTVPDTANTGSNIVVLASDADNQNSVSGYWNQYNTMVNIRVPLPESIDASLINGRIDLLGRVSTNTTWDT
ncbi:MAG: hypothetical protein VX960_06490, partial [Candidatus Neomarinimicrobiota bacterium]|nr:hypothetical protein [Candidatus Neomarinimicrobiota bacterium]